jgi:septum formation protein
VDELSNGRCEAADKSTVEGVPSGALASDGLFSTRLSCLALILASTSAIRRQMLEAAGVAFEAVPSNVDEEAIKDKLSEPSEIAAELAAAKAQAVSRERAADWVIGSDSVVAVSGRIFGKPGDRGEATEHLRFFSGNEMHLTSAVALARGGEVEWRHVETARLQVRQLSDAFLADYLDAEWPEVGYTVGVFRLEGRGVQLFDRIDGDHFTILGMPLIPLLGALRDRGLLLA